MSTRRITITSDGGLEAILREQGREGGAVICHPHPLFGGSMYNNVVEAVEEGFALSGFSTLRFNFRGVGDSEGVYDEGNGEVNDAVAACRFMRDLLGAGSRLVLSGYSFGAWVASRAAVRIQGLKDLFLVAYPFSRYEPAELRAFEGRLYFVGGSFDEVSPLDQLLSFYSQVQAEKWLKVLPSSHFFPGVEREIKDFVHQLFGPTSDPTAQAPKKD
ncbi:MAG TPA: alpha/beta fold hydrolase [Syntrophorhabdales bacterium]|nr:alpha/beta fold hydrolase [Syntrophorhabdales bacterium]